MLTRTRLAWLVCAVVALDQLSEQLVTAMDETMQPAHVGLWVRKAGGR